MNEEQISEVGPVDIEATTPVRSTHTMTFTYTVVHYANPFLVCEVCGAKVVGYIDASGHDLHFHSHPCRHLPIRSTCHSWGPVDGCRCRKPCEVPS